MCLLSPSTLSVNNNRSRQKHAGLQGPYMVKSKQGVNEAGELLTDPPEYQACVRAAKSEGVAQHGIDALLLGPVRDEINGCFDRRIVEIERGRHSIVRDGQSRKNRFNRAGGTKQVARS